MHWQVQRPQAVPTLPLALVKLLRLPRKHKLLQLVRSLQHCVTGHCVHVNECACGCSVRLKVMKTSFSQYIRIGWSVMHCDWFVQVQRLQAVPTPSLPQTMAFQTQREGGLTQVVRCLQHHAEVDGLVGICMYVCTCHVCPRVCGG